MKHLMLSAALLGAAACAPEGQRHTFSLRFSAALPEGPNEQGWEIALDRAAVRVGPVTFWEGEVLLQAVSRGDEIRSVAVAPHPGHYVPGEARAEWLESLTVDLLAPPVEAGTASGVTGAYGSVELGFPVASVEEDAQLARDTALRLEGTARRDGLEVPFAVALAWERPVSAIAFAHEMAAEPGAVEIELRVAEWLARVDFETADPVARSFPEGSQALGALTRGTRDPAAYRVAWHPHP